MDILNDDIFYDFFKERNIALIGDKKLCRHFCLQYHRILNVKYILITSENFTYSSADKELEKELGIKYMPFNESLVIRQNLLVVMCCRHEERKLYDRFLFNKGFEWGTDYIDALYVIQYSRQKYEIDLMDKNIWIFGAGNNGSKFYEEYKDIFHICGFVSNYECEKEYLGLPVIRTAELPDKNNAFVIICSEAELMMSKQLCEIGYKGSRDYYFADTLPLKLFIAIGTCQIVITSHVLYKSKHFNRRYNACIYMDSIYNPCDESDNRRIKAYGTFCDVVFYNNANIGTLEQRNYELLLDRYYKRADRIHMPFYYFTGQLMQATNTENTHTLKSAKLSLHIWLRGDNEINRLIDEGDTVEEIVFKVSAEDYWSTEEILDNYKRELKKIEVWDRFSSFPIKPFIEENYQKEVVFVDGTHFGYHLCIYLANEVAKYLNLKEVGEEELENIVEIEETKKSIMPVYPCVKKALGMKISDKYRFYNMKKRKIEYLEFKEYIKKYVKYVICVENIYEDCGTIF